MTDQTQTILGNIPVALQVKKYRLSSTDVKGEYQKRLIFIGSHPDCDFCLQEPSISRHHAKIELDQTGYRLVDLGSKNGTFIGDIRVNDIYLTSPITFRCGGVEIKFELCSNDSIEVSISSQDHFGDLIGQSIAMREIFGLLEKVSPTPATVLVEGESGCGKELVAAAIRQHSERIDKPFVTFDCSAVSKDLIESELFGHVKGAFTGAVSDRKGAFLQANGGTLFLDEIGELSLDLQPKLLRALENHMVRPVGSEKTYPIDVRVIAATNRSLAREVENGNFREDLYYRLAVIKVDLPPLRKRTEDIPLLVEHFLEDASRKFKRPAPEISFSTMQKLRSYAWPGNVRELRNFIERACLLANDNRIETRFLNTKKGDLKSGSNANETDAYVQLVLQQQTPFKEAKQNIIEQFETQYWTKLLETTNGNVSKAARLSDMHRKSVEYIVRKLNLNIRNSGSQEDDELDS
ncbi:MAG: sigma 54-interacting transcriptional regulator [Proteobacteria bacterium]|nr:sigma 54-interacting transcriptional regulator [Pseudomonadota bacterium]